MQKDVSYRPRVGAREVEIIRRLKQVLKLPVTKIATGVGRHKKTIYIVLQPSFKPQKRGRRDLDLGRLASRAALKQAGVCPSAAFCGPLVDN